MRQSSRAPEALATQKPARRYELDWMRTLVVLGLVPVHAAVIFTPLADIYLKDPHPSAAMIVIGTVGGVFGMPVLFFVAGAAAWFALASRSSGRYARERVRRLLVPLIFATLAICPIQAYIVALSNPDSAAAIGAPITNPHYLDSYPQFYVQYLQSYVYFLGHPSFAGFLAFVGQMWFVLYLFVFSLLALPLFAYLRSPHGMRQIDRLARFSSYPGAIFAFALPLALVDAAAHAMWSGIGAVAEVLLYLLCFIYGYALYADDRMVEAMRRQWAPALAAGLALLVIAEIWLAPKPPQPYNSAMGSLYFIPLRGIIAWLWVVGLVGAFSRYMNRTSRALSYLSDAAYPVYVLHVAVILSIGYFVVRWQAPLLIKYFFIMIATYVILFIIYETLIARVRFIRMLFGLREPPKPQSSPRLPRATPQTPRRGGLADAFHWRSGNATPLLYVILLGKGPRRFVVDRGAGAHWAMETWPAE